MLTFYTLSLNFFTKYVCLILVVGILCWTPVAEAQFAPAVGIEGTTAIHADSVVLVSWADSCVVELGWMDISQESLGYVGYGSSENVLGKADLSVLALGDGGVATCFFDTPLADGPGWDFAVFENSFNDSFLELAFVEVSSDGEHFVRFPATSLTQTQTQVSTFEVLEATQLNNLAGKYRGGYGTPFDLQELQDVPGLDVENIIAVRIIDVIGTLQPDWANVDSQGQPVNDPWPTAFETGGFDLDGVGVIHNRNNTSIQDAHEGLPVKVYPNPFDQSLNIKTGHMVDDLCVYSVEGQLVYSAHQVNLVRLETDSWKVGLYVVKVQSRNEQQVLKVLKH